MLVLIMNLKNDTKNSNGVVTYETDFNHKDDDFM